MRRHTGIVESLLEEVGSGVETEVTVTEGREALTRFANSYIHQNVAEDGPRVTLKVALDGRLASASTNRIGSDSLAKLARDTIDIAKLQPVDPDWPGLAAPDEIAPLAHWDEETASATPADRARLVKDFVDSGPGFEAAGYCETTSTSVTFANSAGHYVEDRYTSAVIDGIHRDKTIAGSGHATSTRLSDLNGTEVGGLAARRAKDSLGAVDVKAGEYEVLLAPECVATICVFMAVYGFNAKVHQEGQSFVRVGEAQFDPAFRVRDDASDPRALRIGFDSEGTRKAGLELVEDGVSKNLVHDRRTAAKAGDASTGHALNFFGGYLGPVPTDVFVDSGSSTEDDLIKGVERGIYVATFNYCRVLDPKTLVVTGLTRNGTFLIENGAITTPITNLRFTQSFVEALGPGKVTGVGNDGRHADSEFGAGFIHCPTLRLASWNFTGGASG